MKLKFNPISAGVLILLLTAQQLLFAQSAFKYRAAIPVVDSSGFYQLHLPAHMLAKSKKDLSDLRIRSGSGQFVPYFHDDELPLKKHDHFIVFPSIDYRSTKDTGTVYVMDNRDSLIIRRLWLHLRNTAVVRTVSLSGSDNLRNWYAIRENILLESAGANDSVTFVQTLNFPAVNYRYVKVLVNDQHKTPVEILKGGVYKEGDLKVSEVNYIPLPDPVFKQRDSGTMSVIRLRFEDDFRINRLVMSLSGIRFFKRKATMYGLEDGKRIFLTDTVISSGGKQNLYFDTKARELELQIYNEDNAALALKAVQAFQIDESLISYLEKGENYVALFGEPKAHAPQYDIKFFVDSIRPLLPEIQVSDRITANPLKNNAKENKETFPSWLIWTVIGGVLLILLWTTFKMTKEIKPE